MASRNINPVRRFPAKPKYSAETYFRQMAQLVPLLPYETIDQIAATFLEALQGGRTIFVFGNGGSAASASHMVCDMNKGLHEQTAARRMNVRSLTDNVPLITALANDCGYEHVFSEQLKDFVQPCDVAFAISGSGKSGNVLLALRTARALGAITVGVAGYQGGDMKALCDICAVVPSEDMRMIEDMHHAILHSIFTVMRETLLAGPAASRFAR